MSWAQELFETGAAQSLFKIPGYFNIGSCYWPMNGRNWQGQIDAIAISDTALGPGSFVIPEPASLLALGAGLAGLCGALRRSRR